MAQMYTDRISDFSLHHAIASFGFSHLCPLCHLWFQIRLGVTAKHREALVA